MPYANLPVSDDGIAAAAGTYVYGPAGADRVRIAFTAWGGTWTLTVRDPDLVVTARKATAFL
jgi:hypothetical protein